MYFGKKNYNAVLPEMKMERQKKNSITQAVEAHWRKHLACAVLYCHLSSPTLLCFSTLSHKRHDFLKKVLKIKCVF